MSMSRRKPQVETHLRSDFFDVPMAAEEARAEQARDREEAEASAGREAAASAGSSPGGEWFVLAVLLVGGAPKVGVGRA